VSAVEASAGPPDPFNWNERRVPKWYPRAILYVMGAVAVFLVARGFIEQVTNLLTIIVVSFFVSFAIEPAVDFLADRGWRRGLATGLVFVVTFVLGGLLVFLIVELVVRQVNTLVDDAPQMIRHATKTINHQFHTKITTTSIIKQVRKYQDRIASTASDLGGRVLSVTGSVLGVVFNILTVALFSFYLTADGPRFRRSICSVLPPERQRVVLELWELAIHKTGSYLYSRVVLAFITSAAGWVAFSVIGLPSPLALAVWAGVVAQFVPVIGTYIGGALPVAIALLDDPVKALWVIGYLIVFQQLEIYVLSPRIAARAMAIHPAIAFAAAITGAEILGPVGAFLALPAAAIIQAFVSSYLQRYELVDEPLIAEAAGGSEPSPPAD
jgi:predicted PurR-regulated permease PerM